MANAVTSAVFGNNPVIGSALNAVHSVVTPLSISTGGSQTNNGVVGVSVVTNSTYNNNGYTGSIVSVGNSTINNNGTVNTLNITNNATLSIYNNGTISTINIGNNVNINGNICNSWKDTGEVLSWNTGGAGSLIVNGVGIGFTQELNGKMYGSLLDFLNAIGSNYTIRDAGGPNPSHYYINANFNGFDISLTGYYSPHVISGNAGIWVTYDGGIRKDSDLQFWTVGSGPGYIITDLQRLINLSGNKVTSLAYDLGDRGGTHVISDSILGSESFVIVPTDEALKFMECAYISDLAGSIGHGGGMSSIHQYRSVGDGGGGIDVLVVGQASAVGLQGSGTISRAQELEHPFIVIQQLRTLHVSSTTVEWSLKNNEYSINGTNIGIFRYGVHR